MRFHKRTCLASRAVPRLHGVRVPVVGPKRRKKLVSKKSNPDIHLFVDHCDSPLRSGNSGSLITLADEFRHQLGVYHWGISPKEEQISRYDYFEYLGNSGRLEFLRDITPQVDFLEWVSL